MSDWYIGGSRILEDTHFVAVPDESKDKRFVNKYAFHATSSGDITLRVNIVHQVTFNLFGIFCPQVSCTCRVNLFKITILP